MKVHNRFIKAFGALLIAALLFGAMPNQTVLAEASEVNPALQAGADRLVELQRADGGWGWPLTYPDGDPSASNIIGPIGKGLVEAYLHTGDPDHYAALQEVGAFLLAKTNTFSASDGYLAAALDDIFGGTTYVDHLVTYFYTPLANGTYDRKAEGTLYNTTAYVERIRTDRSGDYANLAAWDVGMGLVGAAACGADTTAWIAGTKAEIDELDGSAYFDVIGLAGALYGLAYVDEEFDPTAGEHLAASNLADLAEILASYQIEDGGFTWNSEYVIPDDYNEAIQETSYAILALNEVDRSLYLDEIQDAADYMLSVQLENGGWYGDEYNMQENNEVTAEAMWGISVAYPELWVCPTGDCGHPGAQFTTIQGSIDASVDGTTIYVAAGTYNEAIVVNKALNLVGAGDDVTIIDGAGLDEVALLKSSGLTSGTLEISGFGFKNDPDTTKDEVYLVSFSHCQSPAKIYFHHNALIETADPSNAFGIIAGYNGTCEMVINNNTFDNIAGNSILLEKAIGPVEVGYNEFSLPTDGGPAIFSMSYGTEAEPNTVTGKHWYHDNHFYPKTTGSTIWSGIVVSPAWGLGWDIRQYGTYEDVLIENNIVESFVSVGIQVEVDGSESTFNGVIQNNVLTAYPNQDISKGIRLLGPVTNTQLLGNDIKEGKRGIYLSGTWSQPIYPSGITVEGNNLADNEIGYEEQDTVADQDISPNWWGSIFGPVEGQILGNDDFTPWCGDAECTFLVPDEEVVLSGTIVETIEINNPGVTVFLQNGTEIDAGGPCFDITASNVTIMTESPGGAVCYPGSPGIQIASGESNIIIEGLEIDGQGTAVGNGIDFLGAVTDVIISDNYIHDMVGNGVNFAAAPGGYVEITGNLFKDNSLVGVEAPADLDVRYNAWGSYDGPTEGDGVSTNITNYSPWTHVDVYVADSIGSRYVNEVALGEDPAEEITYNVYANLQNAYGAQFTLSFDPAKLEVKSTSTDGTVFPWPFDDGSYTGTELAAGVTVDSINGKITFNGGAITAVSGTDQFLFSVTFGGVVPTDVDNPLFFDEADVDLYGMNPTYGSSLNIYAASMEGIVDVNVYDLPTLTINPLATFAVGNVKEFTLTVTNPVTGRAYTDLNVDLVIPTGATLEYWDGTVWVEYVDGVDIGELAIDATADVLFRIVFAAVTPSDMTVTLNDGTVFLVEDTFTFTVLDAYTVTGTVQMQGRTERAGVLVALSNATEYGYDTLSTNIITDNYTLLNVADGTYDLSITHDRYLDFTYTGLVLTSDILDLTRLELRGGDVEKDNLIDIFDASLVGLNYGAAGNNSADANFDGTVNIQDLAMIGGNFDLQSTDSLATNYAYGTWAP